MAPLPLRELCAAAPAPTPLWAMIDNANNNRVLSRLSAEQASGDWASAGRGKYLIMIILVGYIAKDCE
jgi:hypothetical protein